MKMRTFLRSGAIWIVLAIVIVLVGARLISTDRFATVDTSQALQLIEDEKVASALLVDGEQRLDLTLVEGEEVDGSTQVRTHYVEQRADDVLGVRVVGRCVDDAAAAFEENADDILQRLELWRAQPDFIAAGRAGANHREHFARRRNRACEHRPGRNRGYGRRAL